MPYSQAHQETALCFDCCKKSCSVCIQLSNAFHASFVGCVTCTDCKFLQPEYTFTASMPRAEWWAMLHLLVHRPGPLGLCKAPLIHSLFCRRLLQQLVCFQDHTHHPDAVQAHTGCTTIAACPACMLCRHSQLGPE